LTKEIYEADYDSNAVRGLRRTLDKIKQVLEKARSSVVHETGEHV
jgi:predicted translin family RNA/ssDNA-binding protein